MTLKTVPEVIFIPVKDNHNKLIQLTYIVQLHFEKKEKIFIQVPNEEAAQFVDHLLWRFSEESFLPHFISDDPLDEWIVISQKNENLNQAQILFNLCPIANPNFVLFQKVYDFFDETDPKKRALSEQRASVYSRLK